jgi:hypothetical protein
MPTESWPLGEVECRFPRRWFCRFLRPGRRRGWTGEAGDPAKAGDLYAALLPDRERILGPEHPRTLADRANPAHSAGQASGDKDS